MREPLVAVPMALAVPRFDNPARVRPRPEIVVGQLCKRWFSCANSNCVERTQDGVFSEMPVPSGPVLIALVLAPWHQPAAWAVIPAASACIDRRCVAGIDVIDIFQCRMQRVR